MLLLTILINISIIYFLDYTDEYYDYLFSRLNRSIYKMCY